MVRLPSINFLHFLNLIPPHLLSWTYLGRWKLSVSLSSYYENTNLYLWKSNHENFPRIPGRDGKAVNITMVPGDMVLYESHSIIHGRPFPLKGRFMGKFLTSTAAVLNSFLSDTNARFPPPLVCPGFKSQSRYSKCIPILG